MWDPWHDEWRPTQMDDPPVAQVPAMSSDEEGSIPPPTPWSGLTHSFADHLTVRQAALNLFGPGVTEPGVLRVRNGACETLHPSTLLTNLRRPRILYFETGDLAQYNHISQTIQASFHDEPLSTADEFRLQCVSVRIYGSYVPVFRLIDQYERLNQQLWARIAALEDTINELQGQIAALTARLSNTAPLLEEY